MTSKAERVRRETGQLISELRSTAATVESWWLNNNNLSQKESMEVYDLMASMTRLAQRLEQQNRTYLNFKPKIKAWRKG